MIPIRDTISSKNYPIVNSLLIGANGLVFLIQIGMQGSLERFFYIYGLVPARYSIGPISDYFSPWQQLFSLVSFMFLHGGFWHLLGNMWTLYIFGDNVEDRLGHVRYLLFYMLCGLTSGFSHLLLNIHSNVPTIGASGAIAGVMGAYFLLYPRSKILTLIPIIIIPYFIEIPAYLFLGFWLALQFINAAGSQGAAAGIAWWAHIGGFLFGMLFLKLFGVLPHIGVSEKVSQFTQRKKTPRLQVIRPSPSGNGPHLYGIIKIAPYEAFEGTHKLVNIPWGFKNRLFRVAVPKAIQEGSRLRLKGQGKDKGDGKRGDLFLRVVIEQSPH